MLEYTVKVDGVVTERYLNGKLHREDEPVVVIGNEYKMWGLNGKLHREDGPAVIIGDYRAWWINGEQLTEDEFNSRTKVKELTVKEISDLLGYEVKIIK